MITDAAAVVVAGISERLVAELTRAFEIAVAAVLAWLVSLIGVPG